MAQMSHWKDELMNNPDVLSWRKLAKLTLTRVLVFNGRRGAEVAELKVTYFENASYNIGSPWLRPQLIFPTF